MSIRVNKGKFKINALAKAVLTFIPPTPTPTTTPTPTPTATVGTSPTPTASLTASPTLTQTPTVTPTPSITASQTVTPSNTVTATQTQTPSNTATQTQTPTPSITASQTVTPSNTTTATQTPTPSITASQTPTQGSTPTPTITQTQTPTPSITASQTITPTNTATQTQTGTAAVTPTQTQTPSNTATQTQTGTAAVTPTQTQTPSNTATQTQTPTPSITASQTITPTNTATQTQTPTPSITASQTITPTNTATQTQTPTPSITASQTQTGTAAVTPTQTPTQTLTPTTPATIFSRSSSDYANEYFACLGSVSGIDFLYQTPGAGGGISPAVSAQMYTNPGLTNTWTPAGSGWYLLEYSGTFYAVLPNANGVLQTVYTCSTLPSQTPTNTSTPTRTPSSTPTSTPASTTTPTPTNTSTPASTPASTTTPTPTSTPASTTTPTPTQLAIPYNISSFGYGSTYDACAGSTTIIVYAPPGYTTPMVGMIFYDNSNLTSPHNGGSSGQWFLLEKGGTTWAAQVYTDGEVLDYVDCSTLVSQTPTQTSTQTPTPTILLANSGTMYYTIDYGGGDIEGFNSNAEACAHTTGGSITVYWNGTLGNGICLYLDSGGVTQLDGFNIFSIGGYSFGVDVCTIIDYAVCVTPTPTPTQTPTPTNNSVANLNITNGSLDIEITSVYVNSVNTSVTGGQLPNTTGNGTNLSTTQIGVYTVEINYSCSVSGQHITLTDSASVSTCQNTSTGSNTMTFTAADVFSYLDVEIDAQDGTC
jgi:hypothetical protein